MSPPDFVLVFPTRNVTLLWLYRYVNIQTHTEYSSRQGGGTDTLTCTRKEVFLKSNQRGGLQMIGLDSSVKLWQ